MSLEQRRRFLQIVAGGALAGAFPISLAGEASRDGFKAIAFDAFPIFDPRPIAALVESHFPATALR